MSRQKTITTAIILTLALAASAYAMGIGRRHHVAKPPASEFGPGPRTSAQGLYQATLQPDGALKARKMYTVPLLITGRDGRPVNGATITIDGGMPQHRHGLPTRPRVTGDGPYAINGLRFNMGGWWELRLTITSAAGTDTVTFHLAI